MTIRINHNSVIIKKIVTTTAVLAVVFSFSSAAYADSFDDQIKAAQQDLASQQANAGNLHAQANNYQEQVNQYQYQINAVRAQINLNTAKSNKVAADIEAAKIRMAEQKSVLAANIKSMYLGSTVTPLEMLVSSGDISSFFNKQQYQDKVKDKVQSAMAEIIKLKADLDRQQKDLTDLLASQNAQKQQLTATQNQLASLLVVAAQNASAADQQVKDANSKVSQLKAAQAAAIAAASRHISGGGGCGGYPATWCNAGQDTLVDDWGMYNRECVSYAAWATAERFGHSMPYWGGRGNAKQWPGNARAAGIPVDGSPRMGDVGIYMGGTYGHAMIVEQVKGSTVIVSSFNADNTGHYSVDEWPTSSLEFIHFR